MSDFFKLSEDDKKKLIAAGSHVGTNSVHQGMIEYILYQRSNGNFVFNLNKTWEKILLAAQKIVEIEKHDIKDNYAISYDPLNQKAILKFDYPTGGFTYGNCSIEDFFSSPNYRNNPQVLVETYIKYDSSYNKEASMFKSTIIAFCNTDSPLEYVDLVIPCNNKSIASVGLMWWLLKREVLRLQEKSIENAEWNIWKYSEEPQTECGESSNAMECDYDETALDNNFITNQLGETETFGNNSGLKDLSEQFFTTLQLNGSNHLDRTSTTSSSEIDKNLDNANWFNSGVTSNITINSDYIPRKNFNYPTIPDYSNYSTINSIVPPHSNYINIYSQRCNTPRYFNPVHFPNRTQFLGNTQQHDLIQFPCFPRYSNIIERYNPPVQSGGRASISGIAPNYSLTNFPNVAQRLPINVLAQNLSSTRVSSVSNLSTTNYISNGYGISSSEIIQIPHTRND